MRVVVVEVESNLAVRLNLAFLLPGAWRQVLGQLGEMGSVVTGQGNPVLGVAFAGCIGDSQLLE